MALLRRVCYEGLEAYYFHCPACGYQHRFITKSGRGGVTWEFNGDRGRPTFAGSLKMYWAEDKWCHVTLTDGVLIYDADSHHDMAGKSVPMVELCENTARR